MSGVHATNRNETTTPSSDARAVFQVRLPLSWGYVNLGDPARRRAQVVELVGKRLGGDDPAVAEVRDMMLTGLESQARAAAQVGAWLLAVGSVETTDPKALPIPVSMVGATVPGSMVGDDLEDLIDSVEDRHRDAVLDLLDTDIGPVLRAVRTTLAVDAALSDESFPLTVVDYWIDLGLPGTLVTASFTSPSICFTPMLVGLFETVCATIRAQHPGTVESSVPDSHQPASSPSITKAELDSPPSFVAKEVAS